MVEAVMVSNPILPPGVTWLSNRMFLDWVKKAYPLQAVNIEVMPGDLVWSMFSDLASAGPAAPFVDEVTAQVKQALTTVEGQRALHLSAERMSKLMYSGDGTAKMVNNWFTGRTLRVVKHGMEQYVKEVYPKQGTFWARGKSYVTVLAYAKTIHLLGDSPSRAYKTAESILKVWDELVLHLNALRV